MRMRLLLVLETKTKQKKSLQDHFFLSLLKAVDGYISFTNTKEIYTNMSAQV